MYQKIRKVKVPIYAIHLICRSKRVIFGIIFNVKYNKSDDIQKDIIFFVQIDIIIVCARIFLPGNM